ncbi:MAG TPA: WD40 repeat domain-containing serine/threonine-protein kinase [Kofleriaceae bacterium]
MQDDGALHATRPASAASQATDGTLTREPVLDGEGPAAARSGERPLAPVQLRDPERYLILGEHGRGGLGRVLRAHDRELGRDVAIKELISRGQVGEARFLREVMITARLEHPGIIPVHEAGRWPGGTPFYAMKLVSGRSLRELMAERPALEDRIGLLHHVIAVADAIAYAHGRKIIHRDLKPANVIVGDFGETVVIDWGLAKDLTAVDEISLDGGPSHAPADRDLTAAGSVLGTPAYMAPEQERGEAVDQRADVFAIGAMLWELCALRRAPPSGSHERLGVLRQAGIDPDLAVIIEKALDPDPARRYPDAGALATDLKAFKSGARIAARRYSLLATLAHWIRRHRGLALSIAGAIVLAAAAAVAFVWNIAIERDRADAARDRAEVANSALILEHAELLLHTDPTAAVAALVGYRGHDVLRRRRLVAEAEGRGVARAVFAPHNDTVWFAAGTASGGGPSEIISLGEDRRVRLTRGGGSTTLADDVSAAVTLAHAPATHLLAYATAPNGIAVLDLRTRAIRRIDRFAPAVMRFSPDGARLGALDARGALEVWSIQPGRPPAAVSIHRAVVPGASKLRFATPSRLLVQSGETLRAIALDPAGGAPDTTTVPGITSLDADAAGVVVGTAEGRIARLGPELHLLGTTSVCHDRLRYARLIPKADRVAFACQDKVAGIARRDPGPGDPAIVDTFATRGLAEVTPDATGRYVVVTDESSTAHVYDTQTRFLSHYDGTPGQPSYVAAPTPEFDHVVIGDVNGTLRVWDPPSRAARVVLQAPEAIFGLAFAADGRALFTGGVDPIVRRIDLAGGAVTELRGHTEVVLGVRAAPDGSSIVSRSYDGTLRVWRTRDAALLREVPDHGSMVEDAEYIERGRRIASVGDDGRLLVWSPEGGDLAVRFAQATPLTGVEALAYNDHLVVKDTAGAMWDVAPDGGRRQVRDPDGAAVTVLRASSNGRHVATGTDTGVVTIYETSRWQVVRTVRAEGTIGALQFDPRDRELIFAAEAGRSQVGHVAVVPLGGEPRFGWREVAAAARDIAYTADGETVAFVSPDGGTWLYRIAGDTWAYTRDHDSEVLGGQFSPDGTRFVSTDRRGVVVVRDVAATWNAAVHPRSPGVP